MWRDAWYDGFVCLIFLAYGKWVWLQRWQTILGGRGVIWGCNMNEANNTPLTMLCTHRQRHKNNFHSAYGFWSSSTDGEIKWQSKNQRILSCFVCFWYYEWACRIVGSNWIRRTYWNVTGVHTTHTTTDTQEADNIFNDWFQLYLLNSIFWLRNCDMFSGAGWMDGWDNNKQIMNENYQFEQFFKHKLKKHKKTELKINGSPNIEQHVSKWLKRFWTKTHPAATRTTKHL